MDDITHESSDIWFISSQNEIGRSEWRIHCSFCQEVIGYKDTLIEARQFAKEHMDEYPELLGSTVERFAGYFYNNDSHIRNNLESEAEVFRFHHNRLKRIHEMRKYRRQLDENNPAKERLRYRHLRAEGHTRVQYERTRQATRARGFWGRVFRVSEPFRRSLARRTRFHPPGRIIMGTPDGQRATRVEG